ncbi:ABC protein [Favolaschia claudopus]|uniref:ABC protein n=1 Tax=Favolaschia claudopus TaxID=2862362 RepID=A0AAW0BFP3_9AGAR
MAASDISCPKCAHCFNLSDFDLPELSTSNVLETNAIPEETDLPLLCEFLATGRSRMASLSAKIKLLQSAVETLSGKKNELDLAIRKHEGSLSLSRRLPSEILAFIFQFSVAAQPYRAPWIVSAVCARWRSAALSHPRLWASLHYGQLSRGRNQDLLQYETQLFRSGQVPLDVQFIVGDWLPEDGLTEVEKSILQLFCNHASRWEAVSLRGEHWFFAHLGQCIQDPFTCLRKIKVEVSRMVSDPVITVDIFRDAPLLQEVQANRELWGAPLSMALNWTQLARYGGSNTWIGHLHTLQVASNLVDCSLEIQGDFASFEAPTAVLLPHLRRLSLSHPQFLQFLETPSLLELYCDYDANTVNSFIRKQNCTLQKLVMWECGVPGDAAILIRLIETLKSLVILCLLFEPPVEFLEHMSSRVDTLAPSLTHFSTFLRFPGAMDDDGDLVQNHLIQAIESRCPIGRLKSVRLYSIKPLLILDRLEKLKADGLSYAVFDGLRFLSLDKVDLEDIPPELTIFTME